MAEFELYRFIRADGSSKDWAIRSNSDGSYTTRWGKTGPRLPGEKTKLIRNPDEVDNLRRSKRRKGYRFLGHAQIDSVGNLLTPIQDVTPAAPAARPRVKALYWTIEWSAPANHDLRFEWGNRVQALIGLIEAVKAVGDIETSTVWDGWRKLDEFAGKDSLNELSGQIRQEHGPIPLLLLMALQLGKPPGVQIGIADENGREIANLKAESEVLNLFNVSLESVRPLAEALGLLQPKIDLAAMAGDDYYF